MISTVLPASLSDVAQRSAVCITYSSGLRLLLILCRYVVRRCHMVCGPGDFGGTITCIMESTVRRYEIRIPTTSARPEGSHRWGPTHFSHWRLIRRSCPPIVVLRWEAPDGLSVQKGTMAVPRGRNRRRRDFVESTKGGEIRASVMPRIDISAAVKR